MKDLKGYAKMVQDVWPRVVFVKTKIPITRENFSELRANLIRDDDTPELNGDTVYFPLCVEKYPSVLRSMTASQAGLWAMRKCDAVGWRKDEENIRCCLSHLEMDM